MHLRAVWGLVLMGALAAGCSSDSRRLMQRADARWRSGDFQDAVQLNRLAYEREPHGSLAPQALLKVGDISYLNLRRLKDASEAYRKLVDDFPGRREAATARLQLAAIYENEIGDLTGAVAEYDKILESEKLDDRLEIEFRRANAYFKMEDYDRALRELRRIEEAGASGHLADQVCLKIGAIFQMRRKYEDASAYFRRVTESPCLECRGRAITSLSETYEASYDFPNAIETIRKLDHTPENDRRVQQEVARLSAKMRRMESGPAVAFQPEPPPARKRRK